MANKEVSMSTAKMDVGDVRIAPEFHVMDGNTVFGDIRVAIGGVFWRPRYLQQYYQLTWEQFDAVMRDKGVLKTVGGYTISEPGTPAPNGEDKPAAI